MYVEGSHNPSWQAGSVMGGLNPEGNLCLNGHLGLSEPYPIAGLGTWSSQELAQFVLYACGGAGLCIHEYLCQCVHTEARGGCQVSCLSLFTVYPSSPYSLETGSFTGLGARLVASKAQPFPCPYSPQYWPYTAFYMGWVSNL